MNNILPSLSWSRVNLFLRCQRCFYKVQVLKKKFPGFDPDCFSLNNTVDSLLKKEFDFCRQRQRAHPIMASNAIRAVPFAHDLLHIWRDHRAGGVRFIDKIHGLEFSGVIDDLWLHENNELIVVDYKATAKSSIGGKWGLDNKRQLSFYANILKQIGYPIHNVGYFLLANALKDKPFFNQRLEFETVLQSCMVDDSWIGPAMGDLRVCLDQRVMPDPSDGCAFCNYDIN